MREPIRADRMRRAARPAESGAAGRAEAAPVGAGGAQPSLARLAAAPMQRREALPSALARRFEAKGGVDLGGVRVTYDSPHPERYGAAAYTRGTEIHLAPGEDHNLAHEAWHAVQQAQGRVGAHGRVAGAPLNAEPRLEAEADRMAAGAPVHPVRPAGPPRDETPAPAPPIVQRAKRNRKQGPPRAPNPNRDQLIARMRQGIERRRAQEQQQRPLTRREARERRAHQRFVDALEPQPQPPLPRPAGPGLVFPRFFGREMPSAPAWRGGDPEAARIIDHVEGGETAPQAPAKSTPGSGPEAAHIIARIRDGRSTPEDHLALQRHMLDEGVYSQVASDPSLFPKMYLRAKAASIDPDYRFSPDKAVHAKKSKQEIHSVYDQLHYILSRTGAGGHRASDQQHVRTEGSLPPGSGLANRPFHAVGGTEQSIEMTPATARSVQHDALTRLIGLYNSDHGPVRMPMYAHRAGPMKPPEGTQAYFDKAAGNLGSILGTTDPEGANIRVTDADRGPGAYISTDSDNYYGPNGFTFDPRDIHQLPLSKSLDNNRQHSSERKAHEGHQFRAMNKPIVMTENGRPRYSDVFTSYDSKSVAALQSRFTPDQMRSTTPGMLGDTASEALRDVFQQTAKRIRVQAMRREKERARAQQGEGTAPPQTPAPPMVVGPQPEKVHQSPTHEQPKDAAHAYMMQSLVQEMNGLYEPNHWAEHWRNLPENRIMQGMAERIAQIQKSGAIKEESESDEDDPAWK